MKLDLDVDRVLPPKYAGDLPGDPAGRAVCDCHGRQPTLEIAGRMVSRAPNITRLIDKLVGKLLVKRKRFAEDRRIVVVEITAAGRRLLQAATPAIVELIRRAMGCLSHTQLRRWIECCDAIRERTRRLAP